MDNRQEEIKQAAIECCGPEEEWQPDRMLFAMGAEWADKTILDKVCDWLGDNLYDYLYINRDFNEADYKGKELFNDLYKAMMED